MPSLNLLYRLLFPDKNKTEILITRVFEGSSEDLNIISPQCMFATTFGTEFKLVINAECKICLERAYDYVVCLMTSSVPCEHFFCRQSETRINQRSVISENDKFEENRELFSGV